MTKAGKVIFSTPSNCGACTKMPELLRRSKALRCQADSKPALGLADDVGVAQVADVKLVDGIRSR